MVCRKAWVFKQLGGTVSLRPVCDVTIRHVLRARWGNPPREPQCQHKDKQEAVGLENIFWALAFAHSVLLLEWVFCSSVLCWPTHYGLIIVLVFYVSKPPTAQYQGEIVLNSTVSMCPLISLSYQAKPKSYMIHIAFRFCFNHKEDISSQLDLEKNKSQFRQLRLKSIIS